LAAHFCSSCASCSNRPALRWSPMSKWFLQMLVCLFWEPEKWASVAPCWRPQQVAPFQWAPFEGPAGQAAECVRVSLSAAVAACKCSEQQKANGRHALEDTHWLLFGAARRRLAHVLVSCLFRARLFACSICRTFSAQKWAAHSL